MSNAKGISVSKKLGLKLVYTASWGLIAAFSGALVSSRFTISVADWAIFSSLVAAVTLSISGLVTKNNLKAVQTLAGAFYGVLTGGILGGLVWLCESYYPAVSTGALEVATLCLTTWVLHTQQVSLTVFARSSSNSALAIAIVMTAVSILTGGFIATPALQPMFGALLGLWAVLLSVAIIDVQPARNPVEGA
jgi:hypothetical protein